jgi:hypothetical protein
VEVEEDFSRSAKRGHFHGQKLFMALVLSGHVS